MSTILVTGGTSGPGRPTVERLRSAGHDVRVLSRRTGEGHVVGDLATGAGLPEALAGAGTVVHLATNRRKDLPDTERLLAAARTAGVGHLVFLSIVGVDRIPYGYYVDKVASEQAIATSDIPFTILRATQFHSFPGEILAMLGGHLFLRGVSIQPIGVEDVAVRLAELATGAPAGRVADIGGPELLTAEDILSRLQKAGRASTRVLSLALPGKTFAAFRAGHHLAGVPGYGTQTFDAWLASGGGEVTAVLRVGLAVLAAVAWMIGVWNQFFPEHFYANFPGVALTPPYAEHYARDYGGATLGTAIVLTAAVLVPRSVLVIPALLSVLAFALPHAWFHLHHVEDASPFVATVTLLMTIGQPVATLALLVLALVRWRRERRRHLNAARTTMEA